MSNKKLKVKTKQQILRLELEGMPHFNEKDFQILLTAFSNREIVLATKQARAIMGVGLKVAFDWVAAYWN